MTNKQIALALGLAIVLCVAFNTIYFTCAGLFISFDVPDVERDELQVLQRNITASSPRASGGPASPRAVVVQAIHGRTAYVSTAPGEEIAAGDFREAKLWFDIYAQHHLNQRVCVQLVQRAGTDLTRVQKCCTGDPEAKDLPSRTI